MQSLLFETPAQKLMRKYTNLIFWITFISFTLYSCVIVPAYTQLTSDIMYRDGILATVLYFLYNACDLVVMYAVFPVAIYSIYLRGVKASRKIFALYPVLVVYKYLANSIASYISDGVLPSADAFFFEDLPLVGGLVLFEVLQYALICLFASLIISKARRIFEIKLEAARVTGAEYSFRDGAFPIKSFFNLKNPVQRAAFVSAIVFFAFRAYSSCIYQLTLLVYNGFNDGWLVLLTDLFIDAALSAVCYLVGLMVLQGMDMAQLKIEATCNAEIRGEGIDI